MDNFVLKVQAQLDTSQLSNALNGFKGKIKVDVDTSNITKKIQEAVNAASKQKVKLPDITGSGGRKSGANELNSEFQKLLTTAKKIQSTKIKLDGLDVNKNKHEFSEMTSQLNNLKKTYSSLVKEFGSSLSTTQTQKLVSVLDETANKINLLHAKTRDGFMAVNNKGTSTNTLKTESQGISNMSAEYQKLLSIINQINSVKLKIGGLDAGKNANEIQTLNGQLSDLQSHYSSTLKSLGGNLSIDQWGKLQAAIDNTDNKLQMMSAKSKDTANTQALHEQIAAYEKVASIKQRLETKDFDVGISKLDTSLSRYTKNTDEYTQAYTAIEKVKSSLKELSNAQDTFSRNANKTNADSVISSYDKLTDSMKLAQNEMSILASSQDKVVNSFAKTSTINSFEQYLAKNSKAVKAYGAEIEELKAKLKSVDTDGSLKAVQSEIKTFQTKALAEGNVGRSAYDDLKNNITKFGSWLGIGNLVASGIRGIKSAVTAVYDLDTAMTNLYKVTDETSTKYKSFLKDASSSAQSLGRNVSSVVEETATWAKLGYSLDQSANLAKTSSIYANVGEVDDVTAVSDLVTAMKSFNIEAKDSMTIVDSLNQLGNKYATSSADLGTGLKNSASALALAGNDINESLAMITGMTEITQSASESGNALKILSMRLRGMKGKLEALGEDSEGIESISKIQTQILNLTKGKVNIFDDLDPTKFKSTYEIMKGISSVWSEISETDQAVLLETVAGKQRGNSIAALIQSFQSGQVDKAYKDSVNSLGSAQQEQDRWMESMQAKIQQFKAAFQSLSNTTISSDFLKGLIDGGTAALTVIDQLVDKFGLLPAILGGAGIGAFAKNFD